MSLPPLPRAGYLAVCLAAAVVAVIVVAARTRQGQRSVASLLVLLGLAPLLYEALAHAELVRETYVRFDRPIGLLLPAACGLFLAWRMTALPGRMSSLRRGFVLALSTIALLAAALAVAEPELGKPLDRLTLLVAIDRSRSMDLVPGAESRIDLELRVAEKGMREDDRIGTIAFGAEAATEDPPRPRSDLPAPQRVALGRDGTDIEAAIRRAVGEVPPDSAARIVLLTDGVETRGDALVAAATAVAAEVPIDAVVLEQKRTNDLRVVSVRAPAHADEGEPIDLRLVTSSTVATDIQIRVKRDGELIHTAKAHVVSGEDVLRLRETAGHPGLHRYDVEVSAIDPSADGSPEDNAGSAFVRVRGPALALVLDGDAGKAGPMARALEASGFRVREGSTTSVPADLGGLAGYDLVVFGDIRASDLATSQIDALGSYARDLGGGLVLTGGDRSMGPGGYARTPIEEVSPVGFDLKEEKRRASLAEVIAIDYSGSMGMTVGGQTKLALANEAAARSASLLGPGDRLGVEHVDTVESWTVPLGPVTDVDSISAKIRGVGVGGGGIYTDVALRAAYAALERETVNLKHVLLFADGDDAEQIAGCRAIVAAAAAKGITTSVISLGRGKDTAELEVLSKAGGGRFYLIDDATKLPAVFTQETILAAKSAIHEEDFAVSVGAPSAVTRGIDWGGSPSLRGYVVTVPKPRASVLLGGPDSDPILSTWAVGIGRAAAFTSDFKDRWGARWLGWPAAVRMFGQLGRDTARKADDPRVRLESDASGGELHVRADVVGEDGRTQSFRRLTVHVAGPSGFARDVALEAVGAGRYSASVPLSRPGVYVATAKDEADNLAVGTTGAVLSAGEEMRPTGSDRVLLSRIASLTGGTLRDTLAGIFDERRGRRFAYTPLGPALLLLAGVAMVLAVGARRLGAPELLTRALAALRSPARAERRARARELEARRAHARAAEQEQRTAALLATKLRAAPRHGPTPLGPGVLVSPPSDKPPSAPSEAPWPDPTRPGQAEPAAERAEERPLTAAEKLARKRRERR